MISQAEQNIHISPSLPELPELTPHSHPQCRHRSWRSAGERSDSLTKNSALLLHWHLTALSFGMYRVMDHGLITRLAHTGPDPVL